MNGAKMKFAYADPPYLGQGQKHYGKHHQEAHIWDSIEAHKNLVDLLVKEYPDGWALSLSSTSLQKYLQFCPEDVRIMSWVKPFAAFKKNVRVAYTWEPVIVWRGRLRSEDGATPCRDHISESITMQKGLVGAKPEKFCSWILDVLGWKNGDDLIDIFPGTGVMQKVINQRNQISIDNELPLWIGEL